MMMIVPIAAILAAGLIVIAQEQDRPVFVEGMVVDSLSKLPLANVAVAVRYTRPPDGGRIMSVQNMQGAVALTGDDGKFRIEEPKHVPFKLHCELEGYVKKTADRVFELKPGGAAKGVVIGLDPEAQISGRITDEDTGAPIAGVTVVVFKQVAIPAGGAQADENGRFVIRSLEPGDYTLSISTNSKPLARPRPNPPSKPGVAYRRTWYPGVHDSQGALSIQVPPGGKLDGYDIRLRAVPVLPVRGIVEMEGAPGPVHILLSEERGVGQLSIGTLEKPGPFEVINIPAGGYRLLAFSGMKDPAERRSAFAGFEVVDKPVEDLRLALSPGVKVTGEVRTYGHDDPATDPLFREKREQQIEAWLFPHGRSLIFGELPVPVEGTGKFTFESIAFDPRRVQVSNLPSGQIIRKLEYNGIEVDPLFLELNPAAMSHHLKIHVGSLENSISGEVKRGDKPVEKAIIHGVEESTIHPWKSPAYVNGETGPDGRYKIASLRPGAYRLLVLGNTRETLSVRERFLRGEGVKVTVKESTNAVQDFEMK
jgi:hypothetical protein